MYLSRLRINLSNPGAQRFLADPYRQHQALMRGFRNASTTEIGRLLFRIEPEPADACSTMLVQTVMKPDWLAAEIPGLVDVGIKEVGLDGVGTGQRLRFRTRANPTVVRDGKRHPVVGDEALTAWLSRKLASGGSTLEGVLIHVEAPRRSPDKSGKTRTFHSVLFDGHLAVQDRAAFINMIGAGIGSAKGFGFGLVSVAAV